MRLITRIVISIAALVVLNLSASAQEVWAPVPHTELTGTVGSFIVVGNQGVGVGDFNGDGFNDILTNTAYTDADDTAANAYSVFFGDVTGGVSATIGAYFANPEGGAGVNGFAAARRIGDFNGDGSDDLAVGAYKVLAIGGGDTLTEAGAVYIYFGGTGLSGEQDPGLIIMHPEPFSDSAHYENFPATSPRYRFGWGLAAGDFNNDGTDDLVVTEHGGLHSWIITDPANAIDSARAIPDTVISWSFQYVYLGPITPSTLSSDYAMRLGQHWQNTQAGSYKIASGDWNGDGVEDLAVPSYGAYDLDGLDAMYATAVDSADSAAALAHFEIHEQYGKVQFFWGGSDISGWSTYPDYVMSKTDTARGDLSRGSELLGYLYGLVGTLTPGDYNGDGTDDFVTSSIFPRGLFGYVPGVPLRNVFWGGANFGMGPAGGFGTTFDASSSESLTMWYGTSGGDVNGDGYSDYFYTGYNDSIGVDSIGQRINGQYYVYYGGPTVVDTGYTLLRQYDAEFGDLYGLQNVVPLWDINGDGMITEFAVGASGWGGPDNPGKIYIYAPTPVGINDDPLGIAKSYSLGQNYPNPFNPSTSINFYLSHPGHVVLKLYNILGKEVATLINKDYQAGEHTYLFNTSKLSKQLASGAYFYRLEAGSFISTKKMLLLK